MRDRLRNGHDVIVVGCDGETQVATARRSAFGRMVRVVGAAGCGPRAARTAAATRVRRVRLRPVSTGAASEVAVRTAGGGEVDAVAAVPPLREQAAAYAAWFVGCVWVALPAPLDAARPWAEAADQRIIV